MKLYNILDSILEVFSYFGILFRNILKRFSFSMHNLESASPFLQTWGN